MITLREAIARQGINERDAIAKSERAREARLNRDRLKVFPGKVDYRITQHNDDSRIGTALTGSERTSYDRQVRKLYVRVVNDKYDAEHQRLLLDQAVNRTAEYVRLFCELNRLIP
jgi:hypothetical protein